MTGTEREVHQLPIDPPGPDLTEDQERQAAIDQGYLRLIRDLFAEPDIVLTPGQLAAGVEIVNRGMERHFNPRDRRVIALKYGLEGDVPLSLKQIAASDEFSVTPERIRQRQAKGLRRLRYPGRGFNELREIIGRSEV